MNRSFVITIVVMIVVMIGGYFYFTPQAVNTTGTESTEPAAATATVEIDAITQTAIDFCEDQGGTVETTTDTEGLLYLCATADGEKVEVGQFMADNKTE
ncbi:MAG: DUF333 domain-containing protein [Pseudomonadota bacterium]